MSEEYGFATEQIHVGVEPDGGFGARITPVYLSNGFVFDDFDHARDRFAGDVEGYYYTRYGNPTIAAVERKIAGLEHGTDAIAVSSGQAALTIAFLSLLQQGDHVVAAHSIYEGTRGLLREDFARFGISADFVDDPNDEQQLRAAIRPETKVVFVESLPNPKNDVPDLELVARVAHETGAVVIVDNTLATPYLVRPIEHGADLVVHSTSKFLSGHGSSLGGAIVTAGTVDGFPKKARDLVGRFGPVLSPFNAFLLQQGIETLSLRMREHSANALAVAEWLQAQPEVASVDYPGLASSPSHALAQRYLPRGSGSVFAVTLRGGRPDAERLINAVELFSRMTHIGDVRSLILHLATTTHAHLNAEELAAGGFTEGTVRLSIGIEDVTDLLRDLERGFTAIRAAAGSGGEATATAVPEAVKG